jgi:hypothetical protein
LIGKNRKKKKMSKTRNWLAVNAWKHTGSGPHKTKKQYRRERMSKSDFYELLDEEEQIKADLENLFDSTESYGSENE